MRSTLIAAEVYLFPKQLLIDWNSKGCVEHLMIDFLTFSRGLLEPVVSVAAAAAAVELMFRMFAQQGPDPSQKA